VISRFENTVNNLVKLQFGRAFLKRTTHMRFENTFFYVFKITNFSNRNDIFSTIWLISDPRLSFCA
jgi:hypothetical protein